MSGGGRRPELGSLGGLTGHLTNARQTNGSDLTLLMGRVPEIRVFGSALETPWRRPAGPGLKKMKKKYVQFVFFTSSVLQFFFSFWVSENPISDARPITTLPTMYLLSDGRVASASATGAY